MKKVMMGIVASSIVVLSGNAYAGAKLRNAYAFTIFRSCTRTAPGSAAVAGVLRGVFTYDGEGGGIAEFNYVNNPGGTRVNGGRTTCDLAIVEMNADGSFTQDLVNCGGMEEFGGAPGTKFTITDSTQTGQVSVDGKTIIVSVDDPVTEGVDFGGNVTRRLCILSGTGVFLRDADADDDDDRDKHWDRDRHKDDD
jgi:hypothetical protein